MPQKRCQGGRHLLFQLPQSVYEVDLAEETAEKKIKNLKKSKNQKKKILIIRNCPQKRCPGVRRLHPQRPQSVFEEDEA